MNGYYSFAFIRNQVASPLCKRGDGILLSRVRKFTMIRSDKMLQFLIENGSDINYQGNDGDTALHIAIGSNFYKGAVILVNNGANINKVNDDGETPFKLAMKYDYKKIAGLLREH